MQGSSYRQQLGGLIAERRKHLGLTQRDLADRIPIREATTISRWERGERAPSNLDAVAAALETTSAELFSALGVSVSQPDPVEHDETQLDRIEQMLALLVYRQGAAGSIPSPEGELGRAAGDSPPSARDQSRTKRRAAGDAR